MIRIISLYLKDCEDETRVECMVTIEHRKQVF